jgi:glutamyl-tRNA reductase
VLERTTVSDAALPKVLRSLLDPGSLSEVVVLSTCARTEVYAVAERFHAGLAEVRRLLADLSLSRPEEVSDHLYCYFEDAAVTHLFEVAAGLDSAVLGESEILAQVKRAWERAREEGAAGPTLSDLFRHAVSVGKRARSETGIARGTTSISQSAVSMARQHLGDDLEGRSVLVLGTGEMGEAIATALAGAGACVLVANRTWERARSLAQKIGGQPVDLGHPMDLARLGEALLGVDVLMASTGAPTVVLGAEDLAPAMAIRGHRPLLVVDVAVPRDVDREVSGLPGVTLLDMEDLTAFARAGMSGRQAEVGRVRTILADEVQRYLERRAFRTASPMVSALRHRAETLRLAELERYRTRLARLAPEDRETVEALTRQLLAKLLHEPTMALKETAGTPKAERLGEALRTLFRL